MPGKIILTADDYGASEFIDSAILKAIDEMRINAVGCFVTFPDSQQRVQRLLQKKRDMRNRVDPSTGQPFELGIGLHFSFTAGQPASAIPAGSNMLDGNGWFRTAEHYPLHELNPAQVILELEKQLERLQSWLGNEPVDFISNHHGLVYMDDAVYACYLSVAARPSLDVPIRTPLSWIRTRLRYKAPPLPPVIWDGMKLGYMRHLRHMSEGDIQMRRYRMQNSGLKSSYCFTDTIYGNGHPDVLEHLLKQYNDREMVTEFMMHLGDPHVAFGNIPHGINGRYFNGRQNEFESLMGIDLNGLLLQYGIVRTTFRALQAGDSNDPH